MNEQTQWHCNRCDKPTLHTRPLVPFEHAAHALITIVFCGTWLPIWLLCWALHNPRQGAWRCNHCGQAAGQLTPAQQRERDAKWAEAQAVQSIVDLSTKKYQQSLWRQRRAKAAAAISHAFRSAWNAVRAVPGLIDAACRRIAGEGNDLIYRFLQVLVCLGLACLLVVVVTVIAKLAL